MGRVNSEKRLRYAFENGFDSVDGTGFTRYAKHYLMDGLNYLMGLHQQIRWI